MTNQDYSWVPQFINIPFQACGRGAEAVDCWGLVCRVYQTVKGVSLPLYTAEFSERLARVCHSPDVVAQQGFREIEKPSDLCIVAMSCRGAFLHHVGVFLAVDGGKVLHAASPASSVQKLSAIKSAGYHTLKFYEYHLTTP